MTPHFRGASANRAGSLQWTRDNLSEFVGAMANAAQQMFVKHAEETAAIGMRPPSTASVRQARGEP